MVSVNVVSLSGIGILLNYISVRFQHVIILVLFFWEIPLLLFQAVSDGLVTVANSILSFSQRTIPISKKKIQTIYVKFVGK